MIEVRPNRKLCILNIPSLAKKKNYAFFTLGINARMSQFESQIEQFKSMDYNIIAFDRIGCGYSDKPLTPESYRESEIFADLCKIWSDYIPQTSKLTNDISNIIIIGHSYGTLQTMRLLNKYHLNSSTYGYNISGVILLGCIPFMNMDLLQMGFIAGMIFKLPLFMIGKNYNIV